MGKKIKKHTKAKSESKRKRRKPKIKLRTAGKTIALTKETQELIKWIDRECESIRAKMQPYDTKNKYKQAISAAKTLIKLQNIKKEAESSGSESDKELVIKIKHFKE